MQGTCPLTGQAAEVDQTVDWVAIEHPRLGEYRIDAKAVGLIEGDAEVRKRLASWIVESHSFGIRISDITIEQVQLFKQLTYLDAARLDWAERQAAMSSSDKEQFRKKLKLEWNYNSNQIEGNKLTYDETELLLFYDRTDGGHPMRNYKEMKAHDVAIDYTHRLAEDARTLGEVDIRDLNKILLKEPTSHAAQTPAGRPTRKRIIPGEYKTQPNHVRTATGELHRYAEPEDTPALMERWTRDFHRDLERNAYPLPLFLAESHWSFLCIHPFDDGNGRTARLLTNYILLKSGLPPIVIRASERDRYFEALQNADAGHILPLAQFMLDNVVRILELGQLWALLKRFRSEFDWYQGQCQLRLRSGPVVARFVAAQLANGQNVILCRSAGPVGTFASDDIVELKGITSDGRHVATSGELWPQDHPGTVPREWGYGSWCGYTPQRLRVTTRSGTPDTVRYGLTNVRPPRRPTLPLRLEAEDASIDAMLRRVPDCDMIFDRFRVLGVTAVTCELEMSTKGDLTAEQMQQIASDVCYLLSVAQGCKIEWIYRKEYDGQGLLCCEHWMRHTRAFGGPELVRLHWADPTFPDAQQFLQMTYPTYVRRRDDWRLTHGPIDMYLEAKTEGDYLETKAVKLAVALEALKHRYLRREGRSISGCILKEKEFKQLLPDLVSVTSRVLPDRYFAVVGENKLRDMLLALNRPSSDRILEQLSKDIGLELTSDERRRFIASRNALVRQGQFHTPGDGVEEYFFMLHFLDRIFLKLVGYSGAYFDYRKPGAAQTANLE